MSLLQTSLDLCIQVSSPETLSPIAEGALEVPWLMLPVPKVPGRKLPVGENFCFLGSLAAALLIPHRGGELPFEALDLREVVAV